LSDRPKELGLIASLLRGQSTLALATIDGWGEACVTPLFYIVDEELSLFWLSSETSLHSENLKRAPRAALTVYRHTDNWNGIRGVQMRGSVTVITDPRRRRDVIRIYRQRFQLGTIFRLAISQCALFAFRPDFVRYIDNTHQFRKRIELERSGLGDWKVLGG
jgi:uncharacterized protein YhbP (UPF0306 family)